MDEYDELMSGYDPEADEGEEMIRKMSKGVARQQQKMAAAQQAQLGQEAFSECFNELGIDQNQWQQALNANPEATAREYKEGIKNYIRNVTKRARNPKTGQFIKTQPRQGQAQPQLSGDRQAQIAEIQKNASGSDDDLNKMLDVFLPNDDPFMNM